MRQRRDSHLVARYRTNRAFTTTSVVVRGEHKKRRKGQMSLFAAEGVKVTRTYDSDGRLIGYQAEPFGYTKP